MILKNQQPTKEDVAKMLKDVGVSPAIAQQVLDDGRELAAQYRGAQRERMTSMDQTKELKGLEAQQAKRRLMAEERRASARTISKSPSLSMSANWAPDALRP